MQKDESLKIASKPAALCVCDDFSVKTKSSDYLESQFSHAFDAAVQHVTSLHGPDAGGRSRKNQIARSQSEELREFCNDFGNLPDQGRKIGILDALAIAFQPDRPFFRMTDLAGGGDRRARSRQIKSFSDVPWAGHLLRLQLQIAPGHIQANGVPV